MKKFFGLIIYAFLLVCFLGTIVYLLLYGEDDASKRKSAGISVVLYGTDGDRWKQLEQGIGQACTELGIEKPVITIADSPGRQLSLIQREVDSGAKGVIVTAIDGNALSPYLEELSAGIPVVMAKDGAGEKLTCITADDTAMARELAKSVALEEGSIALLVGSNDRESVKKRYRAFLSQMEESGREIIVLEHDEDVDLKSFIASRLAIYKPAIDVLVVLDNDILEIAVGAVPASMTEVKLYGFGNSAKVVYGLDRGVIEKIMFQNEYAIGYISAMTLAARMGIINKSELAPSYEIQYSLVSRENMFDPEIERLVFPIL